MQAIRDDIVEESEETNTILRMQMVEKTNETLSVFATEVRKVSEANYFTAVEFSKEFESHVLMPTNQLMTDRNQNAKFIVSAKDIRVRVEDMEKASAVSSWGTVITKNDEIKQLLAQMEAPSSVAPLLDRAKELVDKATAYRDFGALKLAFGGAVIYEASPEKAVVIINGRAFSPREVVSDGLTITEISKTTVVFAFRGYEMSRRHAN